MRRRPPGLLVVALVIALVVALPVLAAKPSPAPGQTKDNAKAGETPITLTGKIDVTKDADGRDTYSMTTGGKIYTLEAGPPWFFGASYPLKPYVGKSVTIVGEIAQGSTEVDVQSVNGTALRAPGKPPWAGGWRRVGTIHPGWSQDKADRMKAKFGDCFPPGQCKDKSADEPKESEAP